MQHRIRFSFLATCVSMLLASAAQGDGAHQPRFNARLIKPFGGPNSFLSSPLFGRSLNDHGLVGGWASTAKEDPTCFWDCHVARAFIGREGRRVGLKPLAGGVNAQVTWVTNSGRPIGVADNGQIDAIEGAAGMTVGTRWITSRALRPVTGGDPQSNS
jgi:hypothetical protein